jgi:hypothetical protein
MLGDLIVRNIQQAHYPAADRYESAPGAGNTIDARGAAGIIFVLTEGAGGTGTVTVTIQKCDSAGASGGDINFKYRVNSQTARGDLSASVATYATVAGANKSVIFYVDAKDLGEYGYCTLTLTELVDADCDAGVIAIVLEEMPK